MTGLARNLLVIVLITLAFVGLRWIWGRVNTRPPEVKADPPPGL